MVDSAGRVEDSEENGTCSHQKGEGEKNQHEEIGSEHGLLWQLCKFYGL
jgi:hypothetical protein